MEQLHSAHIFCVFTEIQNTHVFISLWTHVSNWSSSNISMIKKFSSNFSPWHNVLLSFKIVLTVSTNADLKSPMCEEWGMEWETTHGSRLQKGLLFQNKTSIWVCIACTTFAQLSSFQEHGSFIWRLRIRARICTDFMVQFSKICNL